MRAVRLAPVPLTAADLVAVTGLDRRDVWTSLVSLRRAGAVRRVNGTPVKRNGRWVTRWRTTS